MSAPEVIQNRVDGQTGGGPQFQDGVIAILATAEKGEADKLFSFSDWSQVYATFGNGVLSETAAYIGPRVRRPMIVGRVTPSAEGTYSNITVANPASSTPSAPTASTTSRPFDDYSIVIKFLTAGTVGTAGIRYQTSKDGGATFSRAQALGTATTITVPGTGAAVNLGTGQVAAGTTWSFKAHAPVPTAADFEDLEKKLKETSLDFEAVLRVFPANAAAITAGEAVLLDWESSQRKYVVGLLNVRPMRPSKTASDWAKPVKLFGTVSRAATQATLRLFTSGSNRQVRRRTVVFNSRVGCALGIRIAALLEPPGAVCTGGAEPASGNSSS